MALDHIRLSHFRNHRNTSIEDTARFNLLIGENGAGKTNVLEAISLFAPGRGLRRAALSDMAGYGEAGFAVSAHLGDSGVQLGTGVQPDRPMRRLVHVNGAESAAVGLSEWLGIFWLTPAMDRLFSEPASGRRRFLDRLVLALEPAHARHAARAEAALRERNRLLADPAPLDAAWLDGVEAQWAEAGALVAQARARLVETLSAALALLPLAPFARPAMVYRPGGPMEAPSLATALAANRTLDRAAGRSRIGPHRDDLEVTLASGAGPPIPAAAASTGEQKAMLIAITLAHAGLAATPDAGRPRILLLDEVAAHLDPIRRGALFERLAEGPAQVWMTGTEPAPFSNLAEAARWNVATGTVQRVA